MTAYFLSNKKLFYLWYLVFFHLPFYGWTWGFFGHKQINRYAITTLPPGIFAFYKRHLTYLTEKAVNPDKRRYVIKGEAAKHFIDIEIYKNNLSESKKLFLNKALQKYGNKVLERHGKLPWAIIDVHKQLTEAFRARDIPKILQYSADLGHYIADAHVPLHTTENYNGQITGQEGIHALWETRLPFLFFDTYDLFVGQSTYIEDPLSHIWHIILESHALVDKVLMEEQTLSAAYPAKYTFERNGGVLKKQYSLAFSTAYHLALEGQVEERLQQSIRTVGSFWFTAWKNGGSPNLNDVNNDLIIDYEEESFLKREILLEALRTCEDG